MEVDFVNLIKSVAQYGLPTVLLAVLCFALWSAGKSILFWIANEFLVPIRDHHFMFLARLDEQLAQQTKVLTQITEILTQHSNKLELLLNARKTHRPDNRMD